VRQWPLELDERRLLDVALAADLASIGRRGRPLVGLRWVRTTRGVDVMDLPELLAEAERGDLVVRGERPAYYGGYRRIVRPGPRARPSEAWEVRAAVAHVVARLAPVPAPVLRARLLHAPAVRGAAPGQTLDLALSVGHPVS